MQPILPSWFKQRQCKAEAVGTETYRLTGPNLAEHFISLRKSANGLWSAALRRAADGPDLAATEALYRTPGEAWEAAFELYRTHVIV
jgi:hypothetical protein